MTGSRAKKVPRKTLDALLGASMSAIIRGETDVLVRVPSSLQLARSFPKGICLERDATGSLHRVKAKRLLMWLRSSGHTDVTVGLLAAQKISFAAAEREFENLFNEKSH